jgi:hypothetical protein
MVIHAGKPQARVLLQARGPAALLPSAQLHFKNIVVVMALGAYN